MSKVKFTYYPGCSSMESGKHLDHSVRSIAGRLDIELETIDDWNCCGASVAHVKCGPLATSALSGRNLAKARQQGTADVISPCAACYLNTHGVNESMRDDPKARADINEALSVAGLSYDGELHVRHVCEVLVNHVGNERIKREVTNPLHGLKVAGWVGCQTVRPFAGTERGGNFDTYHDPKFLDNFHEACGAEVLPFEPKTACCGGSVSVYSPDKTLGLMAKILQAAEDVKADVISTPCPLCQVNVEMYQDRINKEFGTNFNMPVVFYSQIMAVAFGMDVKEAALDKHMITPQKLIDKVKK
jgi:heterodisulfide reductase subunit B